MHRRHALLTLAAALPMSSLAAAAPHSATTMVYVGSYAPKGRGIYRFALDAASGALQEQDLTPHAGSPSWLALSADGQRLYSADEGAGTVSSYARAPGGALRLLGAVASGAGGPVHLSLHPGGRHLLVSHYGGATLAVLPLDAEGRALAPQQQAAAPARTPYGARVALKAPPGSHAVSGHEAAHLHMAQATPDGRHVLACELGLDQILVWRFDAASGRLGAVQSTPSSPGAGPRHLALHPLRGDRVYVINEEASTLAWYGFEADAGRLAPLGEISSLPAGFRGTSFASGLLLSPDGRWLYALNRLHDSIACFALDADGRPQLAGLEWTRGSYPRSLGLDPSGRWLIVCNERSDHLAVFAREAEGRLHFAEQYAAVGSPAALAFAPAGSSGS